MTAQLGLTASQKAFRVNVIGGSDANVIMGGTPEELYRLWQQKRGEIEPDNLDDVLQVRMGQWTEQFNRIWFTEQTGRFVTHDGEERLSLDYPWMAATLDGLTDNEATLFEAKHVGAFWKEPDIIAKYQPQCHHNMIVCGLETAALSVFMGNHKHIVWDIDFDTDYAAALMSAERAFWACVQSGEPPVKLAVPQTPEQKAANRTVTLDMSENEDWCDLAAEWLGLRAARKDIKRVDDGLKGLIDCDVKEARGAGIVISVARNNRVSIKEAKAA